MRKHTTNYLALIMLCLGCVACVWWQSHEPVLPLIFVQPSQPVSRVQIGQRQLSVPSWQLFHPGQPWGLVSAARPLKREFVPSLVPVNLKHSGATPQLSPLTDTALDSLFAAAQADGIQLMIVSGYRSARDQLALYETYMQLRGKDYVQSYVALPGASEHQTGLSVDLASDTSVCARDPNNCSLDATAIAWLRAHAAQFGFVERYPEGKQSITGIAGEHWHYRYVGVPLAQALTEAGMTLDEFVSQTAPGYARHME